MFQAVEQFHGLFFAASADGADLGGLLKLLPVTGSALKSGLYVLVGDTHAMTDNTAR